MVEPQVQFYNRLKKCIFALKDKSQCPCKSKSYMHLSRTARLILPCECKVKDFIHGSNDSWTATVILAQPLHITF